MDKELHKKAAIITLQAAAIFSAVIAVGIGIIFVMTIIGESHGNTVALLFLVGGGLIILSASVYCSSYFDMKKDKEIRIKEEADRLSRNIP